MRQQAEAMARTIQDELCAAVTALDGAAFREDAWTRPGGGGGNSRVLQDGAVFEKAGVNVSVVHGEVSPSMLAALELAALAAGRDGEALSFFATGISTVLHPHNPYAPTAHANYRYFEISARGTQDEDLEVLRWWFGGGADLTPSYLFDEDAEHFHRLHKEACDSTDAAFYPRFKAWCDEYFRLTHRDEARGIGGIFFDRLDDRPAEQLLNHCARCGDPLFRGAQRCRSCKTPVADELDGTL